jgi:thiol-disulfide isomerase/thioredoxin
LPYLTAAVALVGVVALTTLLLVIALARRLAELGATAGAPQSDLVSDVSDLPLGSKPEYFRVATISGGTVSLDGLSGNRALFGFFFAGCTPCNRQLPAFAELAKTIPGGPSQVVAVVSGEPDKAAGYAARLEGVASVVLESPRADEGTISHSFNVSGWPSYYLLDAAGTVESSAPSLSKLAVPVLAGKRR